MPVITGPSVGRPADPAAADQRLDLLSVEPTAPEQRFGDDRDVIQVARNEPLCLRPTCFKRRAASRAYRSAHQIRLAVGAADCAS
jgi:hypothetical protein